MLVVILLTNALIKIVEERNLTTSIKNVISSELTQFPTTAMLRQNHQISQGKLFILATVRTPKVISPDRVKVIQAALQKASKRNSSSGAF